MKEVKAFLKKYLIKIVIIIVIVTSIVGFYLGLVGRRITVSITSTNIEEANFYKDLENIKQRYNITKLFKVNDFYLSYDVEGKIEKIKFSLIDLQGEEYMLYSIDYDKLSQKYIVHRSKVEGSINRDNIVLDYDFFEKIDEINAQLNSKRYNNNVIYLANKNITVDIAEKDKYFITKDNVYISLESMYLPVYGTLVRFTGSNSIEESSSTMKQIDFILE